MICSVITKIWTIFTSPEESIHDNCQFPTGIISFQVSKQVKPGDDISSTANIIKCFLGKIGKKYTFQKRSNTPSSIPKLQEIAVNKVMETITYTHNSQADRAEPSHVTVKGEDLFSLFNQYSNLISSTSD